MAFAQQNSEGFAGSAGLLANVAAAAGAKAVVTINYGTGTPQEAAAYVAYLDGATTDTTPLGTDLNNVNWKTVGYWAALRSEAPLATDDGLNFLRANHPASYGITQIELGNEIYFFGWDSTPTIPTYDVTPGSPYMLFYQQQAKNYVAFAKSFATLASSFEPALSIGFDVGDPIEFDPQWNSQILLQSVSQGVTPGFLSDHFYVYDGSFQTMTDTQLLEETVSDPGSVDPGQSNSPRNFAQRASDYRAILQTYLGSAANKVSLMTLEFNSDATSGTKQSTSLVQGLFYADAIGAALQTEYDSLITWNLRNAYTAMPNDSNYYGWRTGGDSGLLGGYSPTDSMAPATGYYIPYPSYFADELAAKIIQTGDTVVKAVSDDTDLAVYAVKQSDGDLGLLVINKSPTTDIDETFILAGGFTPAAAATYWQYGETQDTAQENSANGAAALATGNVSLNVTISPAGDSFAYTFPKYSMTVLDLHVSGPGIVGLGLSNRTVPEFRPTGILIGTLSSMESGPGHTFTYSLVAGSGSTNNAAFTISGNQLLSADAFDFAAQSTYSVRVRTTDETGQTFEQPFVITVTADPNLSRVGQTLTISGTSGSDVFSFVSGVVRDNMTLNGLGLAADAASVKVVTFLGGSGNDTAYISGASSSSNTLALTVGGGSLSGHGYTLNLGGVETVQAFGASGDFAYLYDTAGQNTFAATPSYGFFAGAGFYNQEVGFGTVNAFAATGGNDAAYLYDTGVKKNVFVGTPGYSYLSSTTYFNQTVGFRAVNAFASATSSDAAYLFDNGGTNTFVGTPTYSYLQGTISYNQVVGFQSVTATAGAGANDTSYLFGATGGGNVFTANSSYAYLYGIGYLNDAVGFKNVSASGTSTDTTNLYTSAGANVFTGQCSRDADECTDYDQLDFVWLHQPDNNAWHDGSRPNRWHYLRADAV